MTSDPVDDATAERIIELVQEGKLTQEEIGKKVGVSQSTVSKVKRSWEHGQERGREVGREEGRKEGMKEAFKFANADNTPSDDDDDYWCAYCEAENDEQVQVEYMADECPNGHDLSNDW